MLIKTPINQWPLQSYSVTLSQLILIKAEWSKPRKCYHHHPLLSIFFYFSGKKTKPKLLIDRRQGKQKHKMYMADSLYVRLLAKKYNSSPLLLFFFSVYFCTLFKQTKERKIDVESWMIMTNSSPILRYMGSTDNNRSGIRTPPAWRPLWRPFVEGWP